MSGGCGLRVLARAQGDDVQGGSGDGLGGGLAAAMAFVVAMASAVSLNWAPRQMGRGWPSNSIVDPDAAFVFVEFDDGAEGIGEGAVDDADAVAGGEDVAGLDLTVVLVDPFGVEFVGAGELADADFVGEVFEEVAGHAADVGMVLKVCVQEDVAGQEGFFAVTPLAGDFFR